MLSRRLLDVGSLVALALLVACGSYSEFTGTPKDPFDPGPRPAGSGYGSGSGGMVDPGPMCDEPYRQCAYEFIYTGMSATMPTKGDEQIVELRGDYRNGAWTMGDLMHFDGTAWRVTVAVPWQTKSLYKFRIVDSKGTETWIADPGNPQGESDGFGGMNSVLSGVTCAKYTCAAEVPMCNNPATGGYDWRDAVLYFVFVDRFNNGNPGNDVPSTAAGLDPSANWQGGDWAGVIARIKDGYFNQLGVNTLWITVPVAQTDNTGLGTAPDTHIYTAYHGYWPRDLDQPERRFGTADDLKQLVTEAHTAGLKVLLDYAMNHVHKDAPIYQAHMTDGWFNPLTLGDGASCLCGSAECGWDGDKAKVCWFTDYLPDWNFANVDARNYSINNILSWIKDNNVDGFRLDAVKHIETAWLTDLRTRLTTDIEPTSKQHVYLVGETFTGDQGLIKSFIDPCTKLDGQFDFPMRVQVVTNILMRQGKMQDLQGFMSNNDTFYGSGVMSTFLGNQDVPRSIHFAQNTPVWTDPWADGKDKNFGTSRPGVVTETEAYERMALAQSLLMTSPGVPLIYYGDEIGMAGAGDPDNRRFMDWNSAGYNAGQSLLLDKQKKLGAIRKAHTALRHGSRTTLSVTDDTWAYKMDDGTDVVYVILNRSDSMKTVSGLPSTTLNDALLGDTVTGPNVAVSARTARILIP